MIWLPVDGGIRQHDFKIEFLSPYDLEQLIKKFPCSPNEYVFSEGGKIIHWCLDKNAKQLYGYSDDNGVVREKEDSYFDISADRQVQSSRVYRHPINYLNDLIASEGINKKSDYSLDLVWFLFSCYKKSVVNRECVSFCNAENRINALLDSDLSDSMVLECILKMYPVFMAFAVAFFDRIKFSLIDDGDFLPCNVLEGADNISTFLETNVECRQFCMVEEINEILEKKRLAIANQKVLALARRVRHRVNLSDDAS